MKKTVLPLFLLYLLASCDENQLNHKLEFKKIGSCNQMSPLYHMESNVAGDRYTFNQCLPENFDGTTYKVDRKGDTLLVSFSESDEPKAAFTLTLDIDAYPEYHHILLGNEMLHVGEVAP
jgi:hypothetical protein